MLHERIISARKKTGLSQTQVAKLLGVKRNTIYKWEHGITQPSMSNLRQLSEVLNENFLDIGVASFSLARELEDFRKKIYGVKNFKGMSVVIDGFLQRLGLHGYSYVQFFRGDIQPGPKTIYLSTVNVDWQLYYMQQKYALVDPTWDHCLNQIVPVDSEAMYYQCKRAGNAKGCQYFEEFAQAGHPFYVAIPVHGPCCTGIFIVSVDDKNKHQKLRDATSDLALAGSYIYHALHRILERENRSNKLPNLTNQDKKLISYMIAGKTVEEIAAELDISSSAVRQRIKRLQQKLHVTNRQELVLMVVASNLVPRDSRYFRIYNKAMNVHQIQIAES